MAAILSDPNNPQSLIAEALTVGQRNNNYGNLRSNDPFIGKVGTNNTFDVYDTPENGLRALARDLHTKSTKRGINTVNSLIERYAPVSDNPDNASYKQFVAQLLGVGIDDEIDVAALRPQIMRAIIKFENGQDLASDEMIMNAIAAADGSPQLQDNNMANLDYIHNYASEYLKRKQEALALGVPEDMVDQYIKQQNGILANQQRMQEGQLSMPSDNFGAVDNRHQSNMAALNNGVLAEANRTGDQEIAARGVTGTDNNAPMLQGVQVGVPSSVDHYVERTPMQDGQLGTALVKKAAEAKAASPAFEYVPAAKEIANPALSQAASANRRDQSVMSFNPVIDNNEMLIRTGLAMAGASGKGGLAALGAAGDMYGAIQDTNRSTALEAYKAQMEALEGNGSAISEEDQSLANSIDATLVTMDQALGFLERAKSGEGGGLSGWLDGTLGAAWDSMRGNPEAMGRKLLEQLRVDDALIRVAQTKGAISNHEMKLFLSPAPTRFDDEQVWIDWIKQRKDAAIRVQKRIRGGKQVVEAERATESQVNQFSTNEEGVMDFDGVQVKKVG